ncbi:MAG: sulfatase [Deltaproteobacteria bacterium]|nr:sulfatase [Deltaproteobacteria bacterium]
MKSDFWIKTAAVLVMLAVSFLPGCKRTDSAPDLNDKNVVVILVDTLRADHLPFYGYPVNTAPFLNQIAQKGVIFDRAFSASSYTAPSTASIFTGVYPSQHGVITGMRAYKGLKKDHQEVILNRIPEGLETLPQVFKKAGYKTYGIADNLNICKEMGFDKGFDKFENFSQKTAAVVNDTLASWADEIKSGGKYFMYIHYMDPHAPYRKRDPWYKPSENKRESTINAYNSEISFVDEKIKEMFELFGWEKNAIVVLLADHGEEFWEHGRKGHAKTLYREVLHVPFTFYYSGLRPRRVSTEVGVTSLLPTLAELLQLQVSPVWQGLSLTPLLLEGKDIPPEDLHAQLLKRPGQKGPALRSVIAQGWHFISTTAVGAGVKHELFNLENDFAEKNSVAASSKTIVAELQSKIDALKDNVTDIPKEEVKMEIDKDTIRQLKTLGYME